MRRMILLATGILAAAVCAAASPAPNTWDGWISDTKCAAKGANAGHSQCAKKCIEAGEKPVLVTDKDNKVVGIDNPSSVTGHEGQHVKVSGTITANGTVHVDKVTQLSN